MLIKTSMCVILHELHVFLEKDKVIMEAVNYLRTTWTVLFLHSSWWTSDIDGHFDIDFIF